MIIVITAKDVILISEILILTTIAFIISILLVFTDEYINKKKTHEDIDYSKYLPGYNCGICGFGSCTGMAKILKTNPEEYVKCKPMKKEEKEKLKNILKEQ